MPLTQTLVLICILATSHNISNTFQAHPVLSYTSNFSPWNPIIYALSIRQNTPSAYHSCSPSTACLKIWHELWACETKLLNSHACLLPKPSVKYSFPNLDGPRQHLDAFIISTMLYASLLLDDWCDHTVPPFLLQFTCYIISSVIDPTTYMIMILSTLLPSSPMPPLEFRSVPKPFHS